MQILLRSAARLDVPIEKEAARELARRSRGTPRTANRLLLWTRDFSQARGDGAIGLSTTREALAMEGVDELGLDGLDRKYLRTIIDQYGGGPVGVEAIAATLNEESDTLVDMVGAFPAAYRFRAENARPGRRATPATYTHLGVALPKGVQRELWEGSAKDEETDTE